jgi:hypothetical protein
MMCVQFGPTPNFGAARPPVSSLYLDARLYSPFTLLTYFLRMRRPSAAVLHTSHSR